MCTLIFAWQVFEDAPVVAAANRDEALGRPSRPPGVLDADPLVVAPQDEEAGGTWIGYNEHGAFAAVTNRASDLEGERSRGLLVRDALARNSAAEALSHIERELSKRTYAGFNLVLADTVDAVLLEWDGALRTTELDPGVHVVVNAGLNEASEKGRLVREAVEVESVKSVDEWFDQVKDVLRNHDIGVCVHDDERGYGTKSSSLVAVRPDGTSQYLFADGRPCETSYAEVRTDEGQI